MNLFVLLIDISTVVLLINIIIAFIEKNRFGSVNCLTFIIMFPSIIIFIFSLLGYCLTKGILFL
jgi:hypothetical protein